MVVGGAGVNFIGGVPAPQFKTTQSNPAASHDLTWSQSCCSDGKRPFVSVAVRDKISAGVNAACEVDTAVINTSCYNGQIGAGQSHDMIESDTQE